MCVGDACSAALLEDGSVYMWGSDAYKQLGNADGAAYDAYQEIPVKVATLHGAKGARIACGQKHTGTRRSSSWLRGSWVAGQSRVLTGVRAVISCSSAGPERQRVGVG